MFAKDKSKEVTFWSDLSTSDFSHLRQTLIKVVPFSALAVPGRPIIAVYHHIRRTHHPLRATQGKWTPAEDARLQKLVEPSPSQRSFSKFNLMILRAVLEFGPAWERVSEPVGRMAVDCRDRYRNHLAEKALRNFGKVILISCMSVCC